jgi:integrase
MSVEARKDGTFVRQCPPTIALVCGALLGRLLGLAMPKAPKGKRHVASDGTTRVYGKAANGEAVPYYRKDRNIWVAPYMLDGKRKVVEAKTQAVAIERRDLAMARHRPRNGSTLTLMTTVAEMVEWWLEHVYRQRVRASSYGAKQNQLSRLRLGAIADVPLANLSTEQLIRWRADLIDKLAPATVAGTLKALKEVLREAVNIDVIAKSPAEKVRPPKLVKVKKRSLVDDEAARLIDACSTSRYGATVAILYTTGLRVSEVLGLSWDDIDLNAATAKVQRSVTEGKGVGRSLNPTTKNQGAEGTHRLGPKAIELLRKRQVDQADEKLAAGTFWKRWHLDGKEVHLVFTAEDGALGSRQKVVELIKRKAESLGIDPEGVATHTGRRTVVTELRNSGVPLDDIAAHVGHTDTRTTEGYVQSSGTRRQDTADAAFNLLDPLRRKPPASSTAGVGPGPQPTD